MRGKNETATNHHVATMHRLASPSPPPSPVKGEGVFNSLLTGSAVQHQSQRPNSRISLPGRPQSAIGPFSSTTRTPLTHTPCRPTAGVSTRLAPPGRSDTRRFAPRPTVAGSNRIKSAHAPGSEATAILDAIEIRGSTGHGLHGLLERQIAALAHPVAEQVQPEAGIAQERQVRARIR